MSNAMKKIIFYLAVFLVIQIYALAIYWYGENYGFNDQINPITIIAGSLALIGLAGWIGRYLNNKDLKRGYCESGISDKAINAYREVQHTSESKGPERGNHHEDHP